MWKNNSTYDDNRHLNKFKIVIEQNIKDLISDFLFNQEKDLINCFT